MWAGRAFAQSSLAPLVFDWLSPGRHVEQHDDDGNGHDGDDDGDHPGADAGIANGFIDLECLIDAFPAYGVLILLRIDGHDESPSQEADGTALGERSVAGTVPGMRSREVEKSRSRGVAKNAVVAEWGISRAKANGVARCDPVCLRPMWEALALFACREASGDYSGLAKSAITTTMAIRSSTAQRSPRPAPRGSSTGVASSSGSPV